MSDVEEDSLGGYIPTFSMRTTFSFANRKKGKSDASPTRLFANLDLA